MKSFFKRIIFAIITWEARLVLRKYKPRIVAVVGSVGKTTTKDAVYAVLKNAYYVRKSEKSFNSDIGVPLAVLGCDTGWTNPLLWFKNIVEGLILIILKNRYPEWLVLEVGADHPGDIRDVAKWISTDVVVLTRLPDVPVHVEYFGSPEQVRKEKASIIASLKPDGVLILNGDDKYIRDLAERYKDKNIITFGARKENDVYATRYAVISRDKRPSGIRFHLRWEEEEVPVNIHGSLGRGHLYPVLAASAVGIAEKVPFADIAKAFETYDGPKGRMKLVDGAHKTTLIDDTYNSSPVAVYEALHLLEQTSVTGRKIVVLGDMMELGKYSVEEHRRIGKRVAEVAGILATVGFRARGFAEGAKEAHMKAANILQLDNSIQAGEKLAGILRDGDLVLFKASQSIRLEKAVKMLMAEPAQARELLVRQGREWDRR